ncbi:MAG: hypothetical protein ABH813_02805 [Patescibacteria group bacterium]
MFIQQGKTNWKFLLIVIILAIIVGGGVWWFAQKQETPTVSLVELEKNNKDETAGWQIYDGPFSVRFSYPPDLKMSQGEADYFSVIRLWDPLGDDRDDEFSFKMPYQPWADQIIQTLQQEGFTKEKELYVDGFLAFQFKGMATPNNAIAQRMVTEVVVWVGGQVYGIANWRAGENDATFQTILNSIKFTELSQCSPIDFLGYELAKAATGTTDYELNVDLNNDGKKERVRVYRDPKGCESASPIMVKIFSGTENCPKEEFSYEFVGENAIFSVPEFVPDFLGDGRNAIAITGISTGCGSGYTESLYFLTWQGDKFIIIEGPSVGASGCQGWPFKLDGKNGLAKRIIAVESRWAENSLDYCCGCVRKLQFVIYEWDGEKYVKTLAGITQNKYLSETIDEIIQKEPNILN